MYISNRYISNIFISGSIYYIFYVCIYIFRDECPNFSFVSIMCIKIDGSFYALYPQTQWRRIYIFQTLNSVGSNHLGFEYQRFTLSGCKDIVIPFHAFIIFFRTLHQRLFCLFRSSLEFSFSCNP